MTSRLYIENYYLDLINKIDIKTETLLSNESNSNDEIKLNSIRISFINKINEIKQINLKNLDKNTKNFLFLLKIFSKKIH